MICVFWGQPCHSTQLKDRSKLHHVHNPRAYAGVHTRWKTNPAGHFIILPGSEACVLEELKQMLLIPSSSRPLGLFPIFSYPCGFAKGNVINSVWMSRDSSHFLASQEIMLCLWQLFCVFFPWIFLPASMQFSWIYLKYFNLFEGNFLSPNLRVVFAVDVGAYLCLNTSVL